MNFFFKNNGCSSLQPSLSKHCTNIYFNKIVLLFFFSFIASLVHVKLLNSPWPNPSRTGSGEHVFLAQSPQMVLLPVVWLVAWTSQTNYTTSKILRSPHERVYLYPTKPPPRADSLTQESGQFLKTEFTFSGNGECVTKKRFKQRKTSKPLRSSISLPSCREHGHFILASGPTRLVRETLTDSLTTGDNSMRPQGAKLSWLSLPPCLFLFSDSELIF